jgi:hypothetical protein
VRRSIAVTFALAVALALPAAAQAGGDTVTFSQVDSADPVKPGDLVTYTVTVRTHSSYGDLPYLDISLSELKRDLPHTDLSEPVNNPYRSVTSSRGTCAIKNESNATECHLGAVPAGSSTTIKAVVEMNESMDQYANVVSNLGSYVTDIESTTVSVPPVLDGSKKIRLKGLPEGCAAGNFTLKAKSKGKHPKKISASLEGKKLKAKKGKKLKTEVPVADLPQGTLAELTLKATFLGKPQQKLIAVVQRC